METESTQRSSQPTQPGAFEQFLAWLVLTYEVREDEALLALDCFKAFYVDAFGYLDFPPVVGVKAGPRRGRDVEFKLLWPSAVPAANRKQHERILREMFDGSVKGPLASVLTCSLTFSDRSSINADEYVSFIGPSAAGYENFAARFLGMKRALAASPDIAQELSRIFHSVPGKSDRESEGLARQVEDLVSRLRSA